ncbi:MAG: NADH-quinone oxidoreductase subunit L [Ignavibacteriales bacterium]|nr:NADH-quinone oxidoreductase subunit L [Ignavibacteriales bacterium]
MTQDTILLLAVVVLLLPLLSFTLLIFFSKRIPRQGDWLATSILFVTLFLSIAILWGKLLAYHSDVLQTTFTWVDFGHVPGIGPLKLDLGIMVDNLAAVMLVAVAIVSALVHLFSIGYMRGDVRYGRYFAYLGIFSFSMLGIVLTNNFWLMYVFWELVGLSSYLLIGHWFEKKSASDAAKKAFIVNRIGDIGMFTGIMILFATFQTFSFDAIFGAIQGGTLPMGSETWLTTAGILIFCGAIGKSAQFPLHVWLPDAMEGPTPVSALIHAATMVAAGVYLIARTFAMMTAEALMVITYVGAITAFISATIAIAQNDIKKVLAYSTVSQLGYMVMGLGVGAFTAGFFHLTTHAMFKAGLFLGSGSVIHAMHHALERHGDHHTDPQDIRNMGGLRKKMPVTFWTFLMYTLAISGIPLTSGFLSKDEILAGSLAFHELTGHSLIPIIGFFVAGLTAFYMFRLVILVFLGDHKESSRSESIHESPATMTIPLVLFAILSFFAFFSPNPFGAADGWFFEAIQRPVSVVPAGVAAAGAEMFEEALHHSHTTAMILSLTMAGIGILLAFATYYWKKINADAIAGNVKPLHTFLVNKWYFDELYDVTAVKGTLVVTKVFRWFDNTIIDGLVNGAASWTRAITLGTRKNWEEGNLSAVFYMGVAGVVSSYVAWLTGSSLWSAETGVLQGAWYVVVGLGMGGLTFFLFYAGVGGFDNRIVDGVVNLVAYLAGFFGLLTRRIQTGKVQTYIAFVLLGVMIFFLWFQ